MCTMRCILRLSLSLLLWNSGTCWAGTGCGFRVDYDKRPDNNSRSFSQSRIIGGRDALPGEWPWAVSLQLFNQPFCGGSILNKWWILSASHCFTDPVYRSKSLRVEVGATILQKHKEVLEVQKIISHPKYTSWDNNNDISLLLLSNPIQFNVLKTPICLPPAGRFRNKDWHTCYVVGWGTLIPGKAISHEHLQKVEMALLRQSTCKKWYSILTKNMLCAGFEEGGRDACQGDSGGPLVCKYIKDDLWYEVGIVSWGKGCARKQRPGVYTRVSNFVNWIMKKTAENGKPYVLDEQHEEQVEDKSSTATFPTTSMSSASNPITLFFTSSASTSNPTRSFFVPTATTIIRPTNTAFISSSSTSFRPTSSSISSVPISNYQSLLTRQKET